MGMWDKFKGDAIKFDNPPMEVVADIVEVGLEPNFDKTGDQPYLMLKLDDGSTKKLRVSQVALQNQLAQLEPDAGDRIKINFTGTQALGGGKTLKEFEVVVNKGGSKSAAPAAAASNGNGETEF